MKPSEVFGDISPEMFDAIDKAHEQASDLAISNGISHYNRCKCEQCNKRVKELEYVLSKRKRGHLS